MATVHNVPECSLPRIPRGMSPDGSYGEQCYRCPYGIEDPGGSIHCDLDVSPEGEAPLPPPITRRVR